MAAKKDLSLALTSLNFFILDIFDQLVGFILKQLFLSPSWPLSQERIRPSASWAIDSGAIRAQGMIVKYVHWLSVDIEEAPFATRLLHY